MKGRILGLDWFDVVVHAAITMVAGIAADAMFFGPLSDVAVGGVIAGSLAVLGWRRKRAMSEPPELPPGRVAELEDRVEQLEQLGQRVMELEERLDFTERLLVRQREQEAARLGPGGAP